MKSLDQIGLDHGTDKASSHHDYCKTYARYFKEYRNKPITFLELGWGGHEDPDQGGASARMWREYFPNATIVVVDIEPKNDIPEGIDFHQGSQDDYDFLKGLHDQYGEFDIIIDDASHVSSLTIRAWEILYPMLRPGGLYVVEDTHMSYHSQFYGDSEANHDPLARVNNTYGMTQMQFFHRLADEVNHGLFDEKWWWGYRLDFVTQMYNLTIVGKSE